MTQEQINLLLAAMTVLSPVLMKLLDKFFSQKKENTEYSSDLLEITNQATEALRKAREEKTATEEAYEKTITAIRQEHKAAMESMRSEYDGRIDRLKGRVTELEKVQKIYAIQFDLVTHPNVEVRNISARAMDDVTASQKLKAITIDQQEEQKLKSQG